MPSVLLTESIAVELGASEPWPDSVKLYQPLEVEQILLPDKAICLSVQAFLKMCGLDFSVEMKSNAEEMSPSGKLPFIHCGKFVVAEMDPIVAFVNTKGIRLSDHLDNAQKADMRAYMSLINTILYTAEVTKARFGSVHPWPLNFVLSWRKQHSVKAHLSCLGWSTKTLDQVYTDVDACCSALSERLGNQKYFFGDRPTELDALVFGNLFTVLTTPLPDTALSAIVQRYENLLQLCRNIEANYFQRTNEHHD